MSIRATRKAHIDMVEETENGIGQYGVCYGVRDRHHRMWIGCTNCVVPASKAGRLTIFAPEGDTNVRRGRPRSVSA